MIGLPYGTLCNSSEMNNINIYVFAYETKKFVHFIF